MSAPNMSDDNFSDDDESNPLYGSNQRAVPEKKKWDAFRDPPPKNESGSMGNRKCMDQIVKVLKVLAYLLTFIIVLGASAIAKGTMLFMTSQLRDDTLIMYCNRMLGRDRQFVASLDVHMEDNRTKSPERVAWMWCLMIAYWAPEVGTLLRSLRMFLFKTTTRPNVPEFIIVFVMETLHTIGMALLIFAILPNLDVIKGAMLTNCVCFVPGLLGLLFHSKEEPDNYYKRAIDILALTAQLTGFFMWPLREGKTELWLIPLSVFLISCGWWENYVSDIEDYTQDFMKSLKKIVGRLKETRYITYIFVSSWKIICFFCSVLIIVEIQSHYNGKVSTDDFFSLLPEAFGDHKIEIRELKPNYLDTRPNLSDSDIYFDTDTVDAWNNTPVYVLLIQILSAYICYIFGKFACKILIQGFSYAFPINLTIPVSVTFLIAACGMRNENPCTFQGSIPDYLFFDAPTVYRLSEFLDYEFGWIWVLWLLSQTWITIHIWTPKAERLAATEKLFMTPMYNGILIDQSLALNRRRDDAAECRTEDLDQKGDAGSLDSASIHSASSDTISKVKPADYITRVFACATMWHENEEEMMEMLKSIFRMDEDQSARRVAQKYLGMVDPDYYEFETHIFFDDAFEISDDNEDENVVNRYVKMLVGTIDEAASLVHGAIIQVRPPKKFPTPYGGRLVWTLPGKTKMIAHLKDKGKIRHRKRWSQVMYMYYLLGHRLMERPIPVERKEVIAQNTYLLALDGDIDFQAHAVLLLIDLMKKNPNLGAACGRIHPVGSGPMVWYQMFEYAIGHWMQKATEHMIGCVLCSPGCFSLFRGKALMDDNVVAKYTTVSKEARHYVQYDQGEDRWLCTLLLQRGYRVEYSAASDAYTHAPEGFNEFYNQRRRWVPSTMANIFDLLMDSKKTVKANDNISFPYIAYQMLLMGGSILGPGTIFLMLVGAFVAAFRIDNWTSFQYNIIPVVVFMLVCLLFKSKIQLVVALIISAIYGLVMMAVLVGMLLQIEEDGPLAPSSLFLFIVAGEMVLAGLLHPQELYCLPCGVIYYVTIPSMYLLLIIYSLFNLNDVTWGTRESPKKAQNKEELEQEKKEAEEAKKKKKKNKLLAWFSGKKDDSEEGSIEFSCAGLFKCMFCTHPKSLDQQQQLLRIGESLETLSKRLEGLERAIDPTGQFTGRRRNTQLSSLSRTDHLGSLVEEPAEEIMLHDEDTETVTSEPKQERDDNVNPYWIEDRQLKKGEVDYISSVERQFWEDLLDKYLHPIDENKEEKERVTRELKELRDKSVFAFAMLNALFVLVLFLLTLNKDQLHFKWPLGVKTNITYEDENLEVVVSNEYLELEPIGLVFVLFFGVILVIQFIAMLFHRLGTLSHILASTELPWSCGKKPEESSENAVLDRNGVEIVKKMHRLRSIDGNDDKNSSNNKPERRKTIHNLEKAGRKTQTINTLDAAFEKRFFQFDKDGDNTSILGKRLSLRRETLKALDMRRHSVIAERRKSQMRPFGANENGMAGPSTMTHHTRSPSIGGGSGFEGNGLLNRAYEETESVGDRRNSVRRQHYGRPSVRFGESDLNQRM